MPDGVQPGATDAAAALGAVVELADADEVDPGVEEEDVDALVAGGGDAPRLAVLDPDPEAQPATATALAAASPQAVITPLPRDRNLDIRAD